MHIELVSNKRELEAFIRLPWKVYKGDRNWVPPLLSEVRFVLSEKNPFFRHAEAAYFLARNNGDVVGRIAAIIDRNYINIHSEQTGFFGFFECLPGMPGAAAALLNAAASWLKERDIELMRGPVNPSTNDECGFLLEGFDSPPMIMMPYTPPSYLDYMDQCGLQKAKDLFAYVLTVRDVTAGGKLEKIAESVAARLPGLVVRPADMRNFKRELALVKDIYNAAWIKNWGFVPMTEEEIDSMAERMKPLIVPDLLLFAEVDGRPAGFMLVVPDYNQVLKRLNGRLFPFGFLKFLWYRRTITDIRLMILGVKEEFRKRGIEGLLYLESFRASLRRGYDRCEISWMLEDNVLVLRGAEFMGGKLYKKYRIYERRI